MGLFSGIRSQIREVMAQAEAHHQQNFQSSTTESYITRTPHNNTIYAGGGDDTVHAHYNRDGSVDVTINGETTSFTEEEARSLIIDLGSGNDTYTTSGQEPGANGPVVRGGAGNDNMTGGDGNETFEGGDGNDIIRAGCGNDTVDAGNGHDYVDGGCGDDDIDGGTGINRLIGGSGLNNITESQPSAASFFGVEPVDVPDYIND